MNVKRDRILQVMVSILNNKESLESITVREIAQRAEVNLALINYYFGSKDNLIQEAVAKVMEGYTEMLFFDDSNDSPKERIIKFVLSIADFSFSNYFLSKYAIQFDMDSGSTNTSSILMNPLRLYFGDSKTDLELKLIAMQIVIPMQSIFVHAKSFQSFAYVDIFNKKVRDELLTSLINNIL